MSTPDKLQSSGSKRVDFPLIRGGERPTLEAIQTAIEEMNDAEDIQKGLNLVDVTPPDSQLSLGSDRPTSLSKHIERGPTP